MLRIHLEPGSRDVTLRLEGKLIEPWVAELVTVWMEVAQGPQAGKPVWIDLNAVSFVDARGKATLASLRCLGAQLKGSGPFISAVIEEACTEPSR